VKLEGAKTPIGAVAEEIVTRQNGVEIAVRLENGEYLAIVQADESENFQHGERVKRVGSGQATRVTRDVNAQQGWGRKKEIVPMSRAIPEKPCARKCQGGQAIYLALAAIVFLSLMTFAAWNISQTTHGKAQTLNAADAGAYMMATAVARDMNFMAYTNRAMVANHAVVGQLVSLASLSEMIYLAASDISKLQYLSWIPYIGPILNQIGKAFETVAQAIDETVLPALEKLTKIQNALIQGISMAQTGVHALTVNDMLKVEKVIKANDPELKWATTDGGAGGLLSTAGNVAALADTFFGGFSERRDDDTALGRLREVVNVSRDKFTVKRAWVPIPELPFPFQRVSKTVFHGGTQLSSDNQTWVGVDGLDIQYKECCDWKGKWKSKEIRLWLTGEVAGSSGADDWASLSHGDMSSKAHRDAYNNRKKRLQDAYSGIQPYYELTGDPGAGEHPSRPFVVLVYKPVQNATTPNATQTFQTGADNPFHLDEGRANLYGVAAAQAYFRRPTLADGDPTAAGLPTALYKNGTYATLFSPYWQPRLTDLPAGMAAALAVVDR
jgi:hypothetical protein